MPSVKNRMGGVEAHCGIEVRALSASTTRPVLRKGVSSTETAQRSIKLGDGEEWRGAVPTAPATRPRSPGRRGTLSFGSYRRPGGAA